jgi:hypothetical protein
MERNNQNGRIYQNGNITCNSCNYTNNMAIL